MKYGEFLKQAALVVASSALFVIIVLASLTTTWAQTQSDRQEQLSWWNKTDVGTTLIVVRVLQGVLTVASTAAVSSSFTRLHWNRINGDTGLSLAALLSLSPTTDFWGTIQLIFARKSKLATRVGAILRLCLTTLPWLGGVLLFARTSLITVFDTALVYDVTSGTGPFNASYVGTFVSALRDQDTDPPVAIVPYAYSSIVHNLITNSLYSTVAEPLRCQPSERDLECASYMLSGGLSLAAPWTPSGNPDHRLVRIKEVPVVQVEFHGRSGATSFSESDCLLFGSDRTRIAAELCLALAQGSMHATLFLCDGIDSGRCVANKSLTPNITTTMTVFKRQATVLSARSNLTIVEVSELTPPGQISLNTTDVDAYKAALSWLLDFRAANIPAPSSILEIFWDNQNSLSDTYVDGILLQNFRSILAFPIWLFNANNYGNTALDFKALNPGLPPEFYTTAAVVAPLVKLKFDPTLVTVFISLEGTVLLALWVALLWLFLPWSTGVGLAVSSFPAADLLFKSEVTKHNSGHSGGGLKNAEGPDVLKTAEGFMVRAARSEN
ncbi:hypothetical protein OQA88_9103 [Cercophora sp. LCS_1]